MRFTLASLLTLVLCTCVRAEDNTADTGELLLGKWKAASVHCGGKVCTEAAGLEAVFGKEKVVARYGSEKLTVEYKLLDGNRFPRIEVRSGGLLAWEGIYEVKESQLKICVVPGGVTLPDGLETKDGDNRALVVLERVKE